jgi:hypothetical protein
MGYGHPDDCARNQPHVHSAAAMDTMTTIGFI